MGRYPVLWEGRQLGELETAAENLYTRFAVRCRLPGEGLWCAWAVGADGELRLGVLEPEREGAVIRRRFSRQAMAPLGRLVRGELRPLEERAHWEEQERPERLFATPWLQEQLRGAAGVLARREGGVLFLALPYDPRRPFLLTALFCFAHIRTIGGRAYAVLAFDREEMPVFP